MFQWRDYWSNVARMPSYRIPLNFTALLLCCIVTQSLRAYSPMLNAYSRPGLDLDGKWHVIVDPYENGYYDYRHQPYDASPQPTGGYFLDRKPADKSELIEYDFDKSPTLEVPGDWNSQDQKLFYYEGSVWYRRLFDYVSAAPNGRLFLYFGAANYQADVYLNGKKLGRHVGGFTPFEFEVTGMVKAAGNSLVVRVDNQRHPEAVPTINTDWWNYGGLTRDVRLVETAPTFVRDYHVQLKKGSQGIIEATVQLDGAQLRQHIVFSIPEANLKAAADTDAAGAVHIEFSAPDLALWTPEHPRLYTVTLDAANDHVSDRIGFRTIEVRGTDILLNGKPVFLRGISLHEENPLRGARAYSEKDARLLLGWARELNCNFVRLAHYPHNEHMARVADEIGLMLWEEIPVYWTIQWENPSTLQNAQAQLTDLIIRDRNRASVIVWSVANETPISEPRTRFLKALVDTARALDDTRLVSAAMEIHTDPENKNHRIVDDPFGEFTDLLSFNEYIGWYDGLPDKLDQITWSLAYSKPVVISEFGADALQGRHGDKLARFSEEYQADLYRKTIAMLEKIPQWRGATPWILCDFRSPRRPLPYVQDGWNRKGLIGSNGKKKEAFFVLKAFYGKKQGETP
jgi:beta-glucuronidase